MRNCLGGGGIAGAVIAFLAAATPSVAQRYTQPPPGIPDEQGIIWDKPIYDPAAKTYFELKWAHDPKDIYTGFNYARADADARSKLFEGVQGRLAVVDSLEKHEFLLKTFHPQEPVLIGLRYWCRSRQLQNTDGKTLTAQSFQAWDEAWDQDNITKTCIGNPTASPDDYAVVSYSSVQQHFRWVAKGIHKQFFAYFLEFPTGHE